MNWHPAVFSKETRQKAAKLRSALGQLHVITEICGAGQFFHRRDGLAQARAPKVN